MHNYHSFLVQAFRGSLNGTNRRLRSRTISRTSLCLSTAINCLIALCSNAASLTLYLRPITTTFTKTYYKIAKIYETNKLILNNLHTQFAQHKAHKNEQKIPAQAGIQTKIKYTTPSPSGWEITIVFAQPFKHQFPI